MGTTTGDPAGLISDVGVSAASLVDDHASGAAPELRPEPAVDRSNHRQVMRIRPILDRRMPGRAAKR